MQLLYENSKVQKQCTDLKSAKKLFGGNAALATSLFARINAMQQASVMKDIVVKEPYVPCNIDEIAGAVRIVAVKEVSNHYE